MYAWSARTRWARDSSRDRCFTSKAELVDPFYLAACADLLMTTSPNAMLYTALDGWRRQMLARGEELLGAALALARRVRRTVREIAGLLEAQLIRREASHDLDLLQVLIDVTDLGISGYQAADWLREHERIDVGPHEIELESVDRPRDAFFGPIEDVPVHDAVGLIAAEQISPYPPGIPAIVPGERIAQAVIEYLLSGLEAGMVLPHPADPKLETVRVSAQAPGS